MRLLAFTVLVALSACTSWRATAPDTAARADRVRIVHVDGTQYTLHDPQVRGDSLVGRTDAGTEHTLALSDIGRAESRRFSAGRTAGAIAGGAVAAGVLYVGAIGALILLFGFA